MARSERSRALWLARLGWALLALLALGLVAASWPYLFERLRTVCTGAECAGGQLTSSAALVLQQAGLSPGAYAGLSVAVYAAFALFCGLVAALLIWKRSDEGTAVLAASTLIALGATAGLGWDDVRPGWHWAYTILLVTGVGELVYLLFLFPDGRFVPLWTRWAFVPWVAWLGLGLGWVVVVRQPVPAVFWPVLTLLSVGLFGLGGLAQIHRYRRVSTPAQRQQTKWVVLGSAVFVAWDVLSIVYLDFVRPLLGQPPLAGVWFDVLSNALNTLTLSLLPLGLGMAILRARLWDIDLIIRRTLVYTSLTALLAGAYLASVLVLQGALQALTGERRNPLATIVSTLATAALFGPLRAGLQRVIDRRFYRQRYDAAQALAQFGTLARDDLDLDRLTASLLDTVHETLQPVHASVWLRPGAASVLERPDPR